MWMSVCDWVYVNECVLGGCILLSVCEGGVWG